MRLSSTPRIVPSVSTSRVLARPGTPINSACPPDNNVIKACSITSRWPKMTSPIRSRTRRNRSPSASTSATISPGGEFMGDVEANSSRSRKGGGETPTLIENTAPGNSPARTGSRGPADTRFGPPAVDHGDLDMRIARDGTWFYRGSPIARQRLVKLFASVLRREDDGSYWLVTPAERGRVAVEDVPFVAVAVEVAGQGQAQQLIFRTNLDEFVTAGPDHALRVEIAANGEPAPYIVVRPALEAKLARPVFYELVELAVEEAVA